MKRDLTALSDRRHDLVVIGGGIVGACVARDAARRGLSVALVEKADFCGATSGGSSRQIHGGIRYLRDLQFGVVRESLRERRIWQQIAPHQVRTVPYLLPVRASHPRLAFGAVMALYDLLSFDRGRLADPAERPARHRWLDRAETLRRAPVAEAGDLVGGYLYGECSMQSPERIGLECLIDAAGRGAAVANYLKADEILKRDGRIRGIAATDALAGERIEIRAPVVVNAAGPWADEVMALATGRKEHHIARSKGIHLIVRALTDGLAIASPVKDGYCFVAPFRGASLIGTTDTPFSGAADEARVTEGDIAALLANLAEGLPAARIEAKDIVNAYAAVRPMVDGGKEARTARMSRRAEVIDHGKADGLPGLISAIGGKWTTARHIAERAVDAVLALDDKTARPCDTAVASLPGAPPGAFSAFAPERTGPYAALSPATFAEWRSAYGTRMAEVIAIAKGNPALLRPLAPGRPETPAEILHAMRNEMACRLEDVIFRRTGLGCLGSPGDSAIGAAARIMAGELGWTGERRYEEIARVTRRLDAARPGARLP